MKNSLGIQQSFTLIACVVLLTDTTPLRVGDTLGNYARQVGIDCF
ncbi:MAG: hypothetical protein P8L18_15825 [Verrucomicrobiota bacterium]|nr:hypothetical protein [Verrucomicrobiota bacterium]